MLVRGEGVRGSSRYEDAEGDDALARPAGGAAEVGRVVGGLAGKGREPEDDEDAVDDGHGVGLGELACPRVARRHDQVDPGQDGQEALSDEVRVSIPLFAHSESQLSVYSESRQGTRAGKTYHRKGPAIVADDQRAFGAEDNNLEDEDDKGKDDLEDVQAQLDVWHQLRVEQVLEGHDCCSVRGSEDRRFVGFATVWWSRSRKGVAGWVLN